MHWLTDVLTYVLIDVPTDQLINELANLLIDWLAKINPLPANKPTSQLMDQL